ncbi:MAG: glycosyltransferase family 4 protein [Acidobacteriota bacterium]|nr:glycosyltransferase family 4 protein [Acidobacteriota bacterium]
MSSPLRIGIDARELLGETTGVGRYLGELLRRWTARTDAPARRFILYSPEALGLPLGEGLTETRVVPGGTGTWWEQTALRKAVRSDRPDVFFAPAYTAPVGLGVPFALTIHDISFIAHPEWFRPRERLRRRWLTTHAARTARVIFTDSEFSRSEIETRLKVEPQRVQVIPPGVASPGSRIPDPAPRTPDPGARHPLVLFVGSLFNRRRLPDLIAAFARAAATLPDARLVIVGADRTWPAQDLGAAAASCGAGAKVRVLSYVGEDELRDLYAHASVFAFLSEYEGFGLTPLEAWTAGVPIVVLDTPVAREVYAGAAEYVPRGDIEATAAALGRFLRSPAAGREQLARALGVLARYSWERAAEETLGHIERVAKETGDRR